MSAGSGGVSHVTTRAALLDVIRGAGSISRVELTRETGLTGATISTVVRRLIDDGLVVETGRAESTGGKPAVLLSLDPDARYAVGIHLDHAGITYVLANLGGAIVGRWRRPGAGHATSRRTSSSGSPPSSPRSSRRWASTRTGSSGSASSRPGPLAGPTGMALTPPVMQAWADYPLDDALQRATGLPVMLENDATAAAVGEYWAGSSESSTCFAALYMGTGIGSGVMVHGDVYRGASSNTGEIGHICADIDGPDCWCGSQGCVEALAGPAAVVSAARAAGSRLPDIGVAEDFAAVSRAAMAGQEPAVEIIERSARYVALAVAGARQHHGSRPGGPDGPLVRARRIAVRPGDPRPARPVLLRTHQPRDRGRHLHPRRRGRRRRWCSTGAAERARTPRVVGPGAGFRLPGRRRV